MSSEERIKQALEKAREILKHEEEPYRLAAFPIVLDVLLRHEKGPTGPSILVAETKEPTEAEVKEIGDALGKLAKEAGISRDELKNVIDFENEKFIFLAELQGSNTQKQTTATQCILTAWMRGAGTEWISASDMADLIAKLGFGSTANLARDIRHQREIFRVKGQKRGTQYSLTTRGWKEGLALLKELVQRVS